MYRVQRADRLPSLHAEASGSRQRLPLSLRQPLEPQRSQAIAETDQRIISHAKRHADKERGRRLRQRAADQQQPDHRQQARDRPRPPDRACGSDRGGSDWTRAAGISAAFGSIKVPTSAQAAHSNAALRSIQNNVPWSRIQPLSVRPRANRGWSTPADMPSVLPCASAPNAKTKGMRGRNIAGADALNDALRENHPHIGSVG